MGRGRSRQSLRYREAWCASRLGEWRMSVFDFPFSIDDLERGWIVGDFRGALRFGTIFETALHITDIVAIASVRKNNPVVFAAALRQFIVAWPPIGQNLRPFLGTIAARAQ